MKNTFFSFLLLTFGCMAANAQNLQFEWEASPKTHNIVNPEYLKESAIVVLEKMQLDYKLNAKDQIELVKRIHRIIKLNDEKGIESFNKIKLRYYNDYPINKIMARSILNNGKVYELKQDAFKDIKDEEGRMNKLFALEGIEKGAEVEYIVESSEPVKFYGSYFLQDVIPTIQSEFEILSPKHLIFDMKGYNNAIVKKDTLWNDHHVIYAKANDLKGVEEEKMAAFYAHFARVDYTLAYNTAQKGRDIRIFTWDESAKNIYNNYSNFGDKALKVLKKLLDDNKEYGKCTSAKEKQDWIENFVKTNYIQQDYVDNEDAESLEFILKNKLTTERGIRTFMAALYESQGIIYEIGFTTNRFEKPFDYSFPNWDNLQNAVYYFPDTKRYLAPNEYAYRCPFIPAQWCGQNAMFCKTLTLGDVVTSNAEKRKLPEWPAATNYHDHEVEVNFNSSMDTATIKLKNIFKGYNAIEILPAFIFLDGEKREEAAKQILRLSEKDETFKNIQYENNRFSIIAEDKPLILSATILATGNIEKVGNKFLFKIGELIGRQSEMYQEKERQFDVEIPNAHQYTRILKINVPAGYKVNNLDKLNMNVIHNLDGKENCKFVSSYTQKDNVIEVNIFEVYNSSKTPKAEFEQYKKVINAAADFNKIVIVLEKI